MFTRGGAGTIRPTMLRATNKLYNNCNNMYTIILLTDIDKGNYVFFGIKQGRERKFSFMIFLRIFLYFKFTKISDRYLKLLQIYLII